MDESRVVGGGQEPATAKAEGIVSLVLDAGALIAIERRDRNVISRLVAAHEDSEPVRTSAAVVAQVWRNGSRQATLARVLAGIEEVPLLSDQAREIGLLLAATRSADVVDGAVAVIARSGDEVLTSDPTDLRTLLRGRRVRVTTV